MSASPLVLVDGSSYLYRAFHAIPMLSTKSGEPTNAVLGVVNMLYKLLDERKPTRMAVVFDAPGKTFRSDLVRRVQGQPAADARRAARAGRPLARSDRSDGHSAAAHRRASRPTTSSARWRGLRRPPVQRRSSRRATRISRSSSTVTSRSSTPMDNTTLDRAGVEQKFGVTPEQIVDYLALVGDSIDNIPGIPGVGPKTAAKWLQQFHDLETLKARAGEVGGKIGERLRESLGALDLSKQLATIRCDVELPVTLDELALRPQDAGASRRPVRAARVHAPVAARSRGRAQPRRRRQQRPPPRRHRRDVGRRGTRAARGPLRDRRHDGSPRAVARAYCGRAARRARHGDDEPRVHARGARRHLAGGHSRRSSLHSSFAPLSRSARPAEPRGRPRAVQTMARERGAEGRPPPEVRRAHLREPRHRAAPASSTTRCSSRTS